MEIKNKILRENFEKEINFIRKSKTQTRRPHSHSRSRSRSRLRSRSRSRSHSRSKLRVTDLEKQIQKQNEVITNLQATVAQLKKDMGPEVGISPFKCPICIRVPHEFSSNGALQKHHQDFHQSSNRISFTIQESSTMTIIRIWEKRFFNPQNETYDCAWCDKKFKHVKVLKQHFTASHSNSHSYFKYF